MKLYIITLDDLVIMIDKVSHVQLCASVKVMPGYAKRQSIMSSLWEKYFPYKKGSSITIFGC